MKRKLTPNTVAAYTKIAILRKMNTLEKDWTVPATRWHLLRMFIKDMPKPEGKRRASRS